MQLVDRPSSHSQVPPSWRDYCTDEKHALVVKDALAAQEKHATGDYERDRKDRDQKGRGGRRDRDADDYRGRKSYRSAP